MELYAATYGHKWCNNSGWLNSSVHHCSWYGITCHDNTSHIKSIQLAFNNLDGVLNASFWRIRNLFALCVSDNMWLKGQLQEFIFPNMSKLLTVSISGTRMNGTIPEDIVKLRYLQNFLSCGLTGEKLSGRLPQDIGNMTELRLLCLAGNKFWGRIPRSISNLSKLYYLDLQNEPGLLCGNLQDLLSIKSIGILSVSGLSLEGSLPDTLPPRLGHLILPGNNITGKLPSVFQDQKALPILNFLNLANNQLTGDIPGTLLALGKLKILNLSKNKFTSLNNGTPIDLSTSSKLEMASFAENRQLLLHFGSFIHYLRENATTLNTLNLNSCGIEAKMTPEIWYVIGLITLDLANNKLHGTFWGLSGDYIPLSHLDLSNNNLSGQIPPSIYMSATNLKYLDITGNPSMSDSGGSIKAMNPSFVIPDFSNMVTIKWNDHFTCPRGRFIFNDGRVLLDPSYYGHRYCVCDGGYYGHSGVCHQCMPGSACPKNEVQSWRELNKSVMVMKEGFWPAPEPDNVSHLEQCSSLQCNPSGSCSCWLETVNTTDKQIRPYAQPRTKCNKTCLCHHGNAERLCSRCLPGYYKSGELCYECTNNRTNLYIFLPVLAVSILCLLWAFFGLKSHTKIAFAAITLEFVLMFVLMVLEYVPGWVFKLDLMVFVFCLTSRGESSHSLLKIAMFYVQTLDSMIATVQVWPEQVLTAQHYISSLWNLHFPGLSCDFPELFSPVGKFAFILVLPLVCITLTWLYYTASLIYNKFKPNEGRLRSLNFTCRQISILALNFTYFPVVEATISVLTPCVKDGSIAYLRSTPWLECSSDTYRVLYSLGVCSLVLYVLGIPFLIFLPLLLIYKKRILGCENARDTDLDSWLGSIYSSYKLPYRSYFEIAVLLRRLFLAFALSFLDSQSAVQTLAVCSILTAASVMQLLLKPYKPARESFSCENTFEAVVLVVLASSFMIARFVAFDSPESVFFVWLLIGGNSLVLLGFVVSVLVLMYKDKVSSSSQNYARLRDLASPSI